MNAIDINQKSDLHNMNDVPIIPQYETPARYRGTKEEEPSDWNTAARNNLETMPRPSGDIFDCLSLCRRPLNLRRPPNFRQLAKYGENSKRVLPFGVVWLVRDCCGMVCASFTWFLIFYAEFVVTFVILQQAPSTVFCWLSGIIFQIFAVNAIASHWKAVTTDPGTIQLANATKEAAMQLQLTSGSPFPIKITRCPKCYCIKPDRTHHCRICNRCIRKMDHHCPWVNNCVGEGNQKYFVLFTMYICLMSLWSIYMSTHFIIMCIGSDWEGCRLGFILQSDQIKPFNHTSNSSIVNSWPGLSPTTSGFLCLGLVCEAVLFGLFTLIMCTSQFCGICHEETTIESLQKGTKLRLQRSTSEAIGSVMGGPISWRWFSPFVPPLPLSPVIPRVNWDNNQDPECLTEIRLESPIRSTNHAISELTPLRTYDELNDAQYRRFDLPGNPV